MCERDETTMTTPEKRAGQKDPSFQPATTPGSAGGTGQGIAEEAKAQARQAKNQVADKARSTVQQARERASNTLGERKSRIADQLGSVANAFQRTTQQLHSEGQDQLAGYGDTLVEQANRAADYLRRADLQAVQRDVENLARRQPTLIIGSAFALGLLSARFFKSSERRDQRDYQGDRSYGHSEGYGGYASSGIGGELGTGTGYDSPASGHGSAAPGVESPSTGYPGINNPPRAGGFDAGA
jgi:hypothetical protein